LKRFVSLQSPNKTQLKILNRAIEKYPCSANVLNQGLEILTSADLTQEFMQLKISKQVILGTRDTLVPSAIASWYQQHNTIVQILTTGHLPFLHTQFKINRDLCINRDD
jgi:pimeloyl-[acyl-carrier protein] methyl ester esterase